MLEPGEKTYRKVRAAMLKTPWKSFSAYCKAQNKTHVWGRACIFLGGQNGQAASDFYMQTLIDCGLDDNGQ
jgi:hypothetical protein